ncbi:NAD(P)-dependent alcohol dehydrogenase [Isoptericola cucumis]|uniref:Sorbitol dehydrogenase n=1 Tax=Isoptericola cucumis TaxID=1776856 RepID=A0ABQ2BAV4_9MICO|nr:NAD(P)-dependent alcohol dehydrogenase [Isoptericola cucumis]GGI09681.1 sorbitol dehydrogenase [Isoptericola cucumis]
MGNLAAVMTRPGAIEIRERPDPVPAPGQAVIAPRAVGVCGSDVSYFLDGRVGPFVVDGDFVLGHEVSADVVAVGEGVTNVQVGDRVAVEPSVPDRDCEQCRAGRYHLCPRLEFLATPPVDGALIQRLAIDARTLFVMPDSMSYEAGALLEPLSVGLWGCRRAALVPGDRVLVTGAGPVGLLAAEAARAEGALSVTMSDVSTERLALASRHGFETSTSEELSGQGQGYDVLLECSGAPGVLRQGLERLRQGGRAASIGIGKHDVDLPLHTLNWNEITLATVNRYKDTWPLAMALVASGRVSLDGLHTHSFPLARTADALQVGRTDPTAVKSIIYPQEV